MSSAYDLTLIARSGLQKKDFREYCSHGRRAKFPGETRKAGQDARDYFEIQNTNRLLTGDVRRLPVPGHRGGEERQHHARGRHLHRGRRAGRQGAARHRHEPGREEEPTRSTRRPPRSSTGASRRPGRSSRWVSWCRRRCARPHLRARLAAAQCAPENGAVGGRRGPGGGVGTALGVAGGVLVRAGGRRLRGQPPLAAAGTGAASAVVAGSGPRRAAVPSRLPLRLEARPSRPALRPAGPCPRRRTWRGLAEAICALSPVVLSPSGV